MSYQYPFIEKNSPKLTKKLFSDVFTRSLDSECFGWDRYVWSPNVLPNSE